MFMPLFIFVLISDIHVIYESLYHMPVAYEYPSTATRVIALILAGLSLFASVFCYLLAIWTYAGDDGDLKYSDWFSVVL